MTDDLDMGVRFHSSLGAENTPNVSENGNMFHRAAHGFPSGRPFRIS